MSRASALLERDPEIDQIESLVRSARAGESGLLLIRGPCGIGKTALLRHAVERAGRERLPVLSAAASEIERDLAYGVVRQHLQPALRRKVNRAKLLSGQASRAAHVLDGVEPAARAPEPPTAVLDGLHCCYLNLAAGGPLLVAVDDLHWADCQSLRVLAYLARRLEGAPLRLIVTLRDGEPLAHPELVSGIVDSATVTLDPSPLSVDATAELIELALSRPPDARFAAELHSAAHGNPFLIGELIDAVRSEGIAPTVAAVAQLKRVVPPEVVRLAGRRLSALGPEISEVARAAAVLGPDAELRHVASVSGVRSAQLGQALDRLIEAGLIAPHEPVSFVHPLIRRAVIEDGPRSEWSRRHVAAAAALRDDGAEPEAVATQLVPSDPVEAEWAVRTLLEAAAAALARAAPEVAAEYLRRALREPLAAEQRAEVLLEAGTAEFHGGEEGALEHLRSAVRLSSEPRGLALAALSVAAALTAQERLSEAVETLRAAATRIGEGDPRVRSLLEAAAVAAGQLDASLAPALRPRLDRLREDAEAGRDLPANALATVAAHAAMANEPASLAADLAIRALDEEDADDPLAAAAPSFFHACGALLAAEKFELARSLYDAAAREAIELGSVTQLTIVECWRGFLLFRLGMVVDAEADAALLLSRDPAPLERLLRPLARAALTEALIEQDREAELAAGGRADAEDQGSSSLYSALLDFANGRLACARQRHEEGTRTLARAGEVLGRLGATSPSIAPWRSEAALAHAACGERERAQALADEELGLARAFGAPRALGIALRAAGLVRGDEEGIRLLEEASGVLRSSPAKLDYARALTDWGAALRRAGHRTAAREHLRPALDLTVRLGATRLRRRAETELRAAGGRPRRLLLSGMESLTASERRIAELAADGLTNRQIADALFVTPRTVEGHLTQVFRKLEISGRRELPLATATGEPRRR